MNELLKTIKKSHAVPFTFTMRRARSACVALGGQHLLDEMLVVLPAKVKSDEARSAPWNVAVAARMKQISEVPNAWLAEKLGMGSGFYFGKHVSRLRQAPDHPARQYLPRLEKVQHAPFELSN